jgi:hypothetical protein
VDLLQRDQETELLERVGRYREEYRNSRAAALEQERERRLASDQVYLDGFWLRAQDADRIGRVLQKRELLAFFEIAFLLILLGGVALGLCWLFAFLFLPE